MNNIRKYTAWLGAGAILITLATGCTNKDGDAVPDATENVVDGAVSTTENVADAAANTTENMVDAAGNNMSEAGQAVENSADAAGTNMAKGAEATGDAMAGAGDAMTYTPKIKTALGANAAMEGSKIDVDTLADKKVIALRGTVKSSAQKTMAEAIAKKNAPADYTVENQLTMADGKM